MNMLTLLLFLLAQDLEAPVDPTPADAPAMGMFVFVPGGEFSMGDHSGEGREREAPVHPVHVSDFHIGALEVSNSEYSEFMEDGGYTERAYWSAGGYGVSLEPRHWVEPEFRGGGLEGNARFPVVGVSWFEANAYCAWLSATMSETYRLPTEAEWEKAARGGLYLDGDAEGKTPNPLGPARKYPWGNEIDGSYSNFIDSGDPYELGLTPTGFYDGNEHRGFKTHDNASPYGARDMAGNTYEWCSDRYGETYYAECLDSGVVSDPAGPPSGPTFVIRGSSFGFEVFKHRCAYRGAYPPNAREAHIGLRCVREVSARNS